LGTRPLGYLYDPVHSEIGVRRSCRSNTISFICLSDVQNKKKKRKRGGSVTEGAHGSLGRHDRIPTHFTLLSPSLASRKF